MKLILAVHYQLKHVYAMWVYHELTIAYLPIWLGSSVDRALHRYHKVMGSNPVEAGILFFGLLFKCLS